jgi:hypothetical protein
MTDTYEQEREKAAVEKAPQAEPVDPVALRMETGRHNMQGSPLNIYPMVDEGTKEATEEAKPLTDDEAAVLGHSVAARYVPPAPPLSIVEQIEAAKGKGAQPAPPAPPPQPQS